MVKNLFENAFSIGQAELKSLRETDSAFDEACKDFEELCELKAETLRRGDKGAEGAVQISIEEVKLEIRERLIKLASNVHASRLAPRKHGDSI